MKPIKYLLFALTLGITSMAVAQIEPIDTGGLAIGGYDVVAYFSGQAEKGSSNYSVKHDGGTYYFTKEANRIAFKAAPTKYLPQFDGYCAWGVGAKGTKFPINPETFDIIDGKLYLFFNGPFNGETFNSLEPWNEETTALLNKANNNWEKVSKS